MLQAPAQGSSVLFASCHGLTFSKNSPRQRAEQGALVCQDWPGPQDWKGPLSSNHYLDADDLHQAASFRGLITFLLSDFSAATDKALEFSASASSTSATYTPFVSRLAQRLLCHPKGGALAVVGNVGGVWSYSLNRSFMGASAAIFERVLERLFRGYPIGFAQELLSMRYAELASDLSAAIEDVTEGRNLDFLSLAGLWTTHNDVGNLVILGDPAVRLSTK